MRLRRRTDARPVDVPVHEADSESDPDSEPWSGPRDIDEVDVENDGVDRLDLGSLLIDPGPGREVRLQVEEDTQTLQSVLIAGTDGAVELRAFAAPRHGDLWAEVRPRIAAEMASRGGTSTPREGRWGPELLCQMSVRLPDGKTATQPSRMVGINGSRWLLRATWYGRPAVDPEGATDWEDALDGIVVRRGAHAMPVGDPLPLTLPPQARRPPPAETSGD